MKDYYRMSASSGNLAENSTPRFVSAEYHSLRGRRLIVRPTQRSDGPRFRAFLQAVDDNDIHMRMMRVVREVPEQHVRRVVEADHVRDVAFVAVVTGEGEPTFLGVVEAHFEPSNASADFALLVASGMQRQGIGTLLMDKLIRYCRDRGVRRLVGETFPHNEGMIALARRLGFRVAWSSVKGATELVLEFGRQSQPHLAPVIPLRPLGAPKSDSRGTPPDH